MANENNEERSYEVKDKRRVNPDGTLKEETERTSEPEPEQAAAENAQAEPTAEAAAPRPEQEPQPEAEQEQLPPPNVYGMLEFMLGIMSEQAWQLMGIRLAPGQKEMVKDMAQAKLAIDTVVFITDKLEPQLGEEDRKALRGLISDLQMNFVVQSK